MSANKQQLSHNTNKTGYYGKHLNDNGMGNDDTIYEIW